MAKFVSISGPSSTGKTQLIEYLSTYPELSNAVFSPDLYETVWGDLTHQGFFSEYSEINRDVEYISIYLLRLAEYYDNYMKKYEDTDKLVILDGCWIDLSVYALVNMWYTRVIKEVQEHIFYKLNRYDSRLDRIYFTNFDESKQMNQKYRIPYRVSNIKLNRPLEIQYYNLAHNYKNAVSLPTTDLVDASMFIVEDFKKLGYI